MKQNFLPTSMLLLSVATLAMSGASFGSEDQQGFFNRMFGTGKAPGVAPVENSQYLEECGSCHFPYQPGLLPARSWKKLMTGLEDHFGENAELPVEDSKTLTYYIVKNAADHANYKRSKKIMRSLHPDEAPIRVSETPYFIAKHKELSRNKVQGNPKVGSISKCNACHTKAETGSYSESQIFIPGFGGWEERD